MFRHLKLALFLALMVFVFLTQVAATGTATALSIAGAVGVIAPFILAYVPLDGRGMTILTAVLAIVIGFVAEVLSGEVSLSNLANLNPTALIAAMTACYGAMQVVYSFFKDHPLGPLKVH